MNFAVIFCVKRTMLGVQILRRHGKGVAVFFAFEGCVVVSTVGVDHAFGEGSGVHQFGEGGGEVVVLLVELALGADDDAHVGERGGLGVGAGRIAVKLGRVNGSGLRCGADSRWRILREERAGEKQECEDGEG